MTPRISLSAALIAPCPGLKTKEVNVPGKREFISYLPPVVLLAREGLTDKRATPNEGLSGSASYSFYSILCMATCCFRDNRTSWPS